MLLQAIQPITLPFVMFLWPIPLVWKTPMPSTRLWCLHQSKYMLTWRTHSPVLRQWSYCICMKCCLDLLYSHWMYTLWTIKTIKKALCIISYPLVSSNWSYSPETPNLGQLRRILEPCDLEIWRVTFKNNRAPLLSNIKLYTSFHHHTRIQTGVTVRKRLSWVVTSVTLTFDLDLLRGPYPGPWW